MDLRQALQRLHSVGASIAAWRQDIHTFFGATGQGETVVLSLYFKYLNVIDGLDQLLSIRASRRKWHLIDLSQVFEEVVGARIKSKRSSVSSISSLC